MNNPVMQRQMFMAIGTPSRKPEEGIVSGMESVEGYEDRTPDNLEIIANNLRGDIRSMDERYLELAGMVGEAAFDTPEEVLALMQSQLQQQGAPAAAAPPPPPAASPKMGGIEALMAGNAPQQGAPQGMPMPEQGMPMPEQGMPPGPGGAPVGIEGIMPSNFAEGGEVELFSAPYPTTAYPIDAQEEIDRAIDTIKTRRVNEALQNKIFLYKNGMISLNDLAQYMPGISTYDIANMFGGTDSNPLGRKFEYQLTPPIFTPPTKEEEDLSGMDLDQLEKLGSGKGLSEQDFGDFGPSRIPNVSNLGKLGAFDYFENPKPHHGLRDALRSYISVPNPGGIEGLVAPPTEQAPVMRQAGSPPTGEVSRNMRVTLPPSAYPSYLEAMRSYGRAAPTSVPSKNLYSQSILDLLKTEAPTSRSGRPIPFVDRSGRMYQPVGGTDPRMASRGTPFMPRASYGAQASRVLGPAGYVLGAGMLGTEALMSTDKSAGETTGDSFGLEFGSSVAGTPGYRYLPGMEPTPVPAPISQQPSGLVEKIPVAPTAPPTLPSRESDAADAVAIAPGVVPSAKEEEEVSEAGVKGTLPAPPKPTERGLKERTEERYKIYRDLLGDDKNMRQAQALFLLAEAALNVGGAKSKQRGVSGTLERLTTGLKGLPAGLAALGAEASREDKALKTAAISAVEQEMAAEAKERGLLQRESLKLMSKAAPINDLAASFKGRYPGYDDGFYVRMAKDYKSGLIKELPDTSELYDVASGKVLLSPLNPNDKERVGYLDPDMPFTSTSNKRLSRATNKQRPELIDRISNNESLVQDIENFYKDIMDKNFIGVVPSIQSGLTNITLPFFGENPFSNVPLQQQRNAGLQMNQRLREMAMAYRGRPSNWSEEQVNKYLVDPQAIFKDKSQFFAVLENFRQGAINEINRDYHRLFPEQVPLRQLSQVPLGDKKSPLESKDLKYMGEMFRVNPNREVYVKLPDGTSERVTAESFRTMTGQQ